MTHSVTHSVTGHHASEVDSVTQYPHIVEVLADPIKREQLRRVCQAFKNKELLKEVRYGISGVTMDKVAELLTAF